MTRGPEALGPISEAATRYAAAGLFVVPLHGIVGGVCSCKTGAGCPSPGKHPRHRSWQRDASSNPELIGGLWSRYGEGANVGIALRPSELALIDIDSREGEALLLELLEGAPMPDCPEVQTRRGRHLYVAPEGLRPFPAPGLDIKLDGVAVAPPSRRADGLRYEWVLGRELIPGLEPS